MKQGQISQILLRQSNQFKNQTSTTSNLNNKSNDPSQQIADTFAKINDTIDNLDGKVNILLQKHEAQFLLAWRNHIKKIKKELYDIKQKADEKEKQMNSNQKLVSLEKQMTLFRDQSLRLYEQVEERKSQLQIFKRKIKQQQEQLEILRQENKQLVKNGKIAQVRNNLSQQRISQLQQLLLQIRNNAVVEGEKLNSQNKKFSVNSNFTQNNFYQSHQKKYSIGLSLVQLERLNQNSSNKIHSKKAKRLYQQTPHDPFYIPSIKGEKPNKLSMTTSKHTQIRQSTNTKHSPQQDNKRRNFSILQSPSKPLNHTTFIMIEPTVYDTDLKNWFLDCVKSIKKQISSRKIGFSSTANDILKVQSIQEFKTIDKLRLLEMFLQNQKLLIYMYQKVFPDRMKEIQTYLQANNYKHQSIGNQEQRITTAKGKVDEMIRNEQKANNLAGEDEGKIEQFLNNDCNFKYQNNVKIRVKSVGKASKSQPIRNRVIMRNGKLSLVF